MSVSRIPLRLSTARLASSVRFVSSQAPPPPPPPQPEQPESSKASRAKVAFLSGASPDQPEVKSVKDKDPYAVPPLSRPLGTTKVPTSIPKTWAEKKEELLDRDRHKAKRKALLKEASQGYFHDYNLAKKANGGKLWVAPPVLIREDVSISGDVADRSARSTFPTLVARP